MSAETTPSSEASSAPRASDEVAFVFGGGGHNGAVEVGMLQALLEHGRQPGLIVGTSVGAMNGAALAADPSLEAVSLLRKEWSSIDIERIFGGSIFSGAVKLVRRRTHLHSNAALRRFLEDVLPSRRFTDLKIPFQCVAASIERAEEHWFSEGSLIDAILASTAVPGVLPPVEIGGEHFVDGGIVNSIPLSRAIELGAKEIFVFQVGRIEHPLEVPKTPLQVALVAFEIARRHRFARDLASTPEGVTVHVLPTGEPQRPSLSQLNYRGFKEIDARIARAHDATAEYLRSNLPVSKA